MGLARVAREEGKASDGGKLAGEAADDLGTQSASQCEAAARAEHALCLLESGKLDEADRAAQRALGRLTPKSEEELSLTVDLARGGGVARAGRPREAMPVLEGARAGGLTVRQRPARAGGSPGAGAALESLSLDARSKGFLLIARKAALRASR